MLSKLLRVNLLLVKWAQLHSKLGKGRVNFRPLLPGTYSIEIIRDGKKASAKIIEITDGVLDLGTI